MLISCNGPLWDNMHPLLWDHMHPLLEYFIFFYRPLFTPTGELDTSAPFSPLIRQEREKLCSEDILKILAEFRR